MTRESDLLDQCRNGKKEAFYELVEPHIKKAYRTAFAILHSHHEAEDAVQNCLLEAYKSIMSQKEIQVFGGWFHQLIVHRSLDLARRKMKESERLTVAEVLPILSSKERSPIDKVLEAERHDQLLSQILKLHSHHRTVIVLYYFQEMSIEEISRMLELKEGTVKSRLFHARTQLSQMYMSEPKEDVQ